MRRKQYAQGTSGIIPMPIEMPYDNTKEQFVQQAAGVGVGAGLTALGIPAPLAMTLGQGASGLLLGEEFMGMKGLDLLGAGKRADEKHQAFKRNYDRVNASNRIAYTDPMMTAQDGMRVQTPKPIEVEEDELVFDKNFRLKADFKSGKKHSEGGEPYVAAEGDIIFPAKMRKKVEAAYKANDVIRLRSYQAQLPPDTGQGQFRDGARGIKTPGGIYTVGGYPPEVNPLDQYDMMNRPSPMLPPIAPEVTPDLDAYDTFVRGVPMDPTKIQAPPPEPDTYTTRTINKTPEFDYGSALSIPTNPGSIPETYNSIADTANQFAFNVSGPPYDGTAESPVGAGLNVGDMSGLKKLGNRGFWNTAATYAPTIYDLSTALTQQAFEEIPMQYNPRYMAYTDRSDNVRAQARQMRDIANANAANLSGGNINNVRANAAQAQGAMMQSMRGIDQAESQRYDTIQSMNAQLANQFMGVQAQENIRAQTATMQNQAKRKELITTGLENLSQGVQMDMLNNKKDAMIQQQMANQMEMDRRKSNALNSMGLFEAVLDENGIATGEFKINNKKMLEALNLAQFSPAETKQTNTPTTQYKTSRRQRGNKRGPSVAGMTTIQG